MAPLFINQDAATVEYMLWSGGFYLALVCTPHVFGLSTYVPVFSFACAVFIVGYLPAFAHMSYDPVFAILLSVSHFDWGGVPNFEHRLAPTPRSASVRVLLLGSGIFTE